SRQLLPGGRFDPGPSFSNPLETRTFRFLKPRKHPGSPLAVSAVVEVVDSLSERGDERACKRRGRGDYERNFKRSGACRSGCSRSRANGRHAARGEILAGLPSNAWWLVRGGP